MSIDENQIKPQIFPCFKSIKNNRGGANYYGPEPYDHPWVDAPGKECELCDRLKAIYGDKPIKNKLNWNPFKGWFQSGL